MDRFSHKKTVAMLGLVVGMTMATTGFAMKHGGMKDRFYATDGAKDPLKNVAGECWNTAGGTPGPKEACGDKMPMPMAEKPAPMPNLMAMASTTTVTAARVPVPAPRLTSTVARWWPT